VGPCPGPGNAGSPALRWGKLCDRQAGEVRAEARGDHVIPLYDNVPTRRFPVVTVGLIIVNLAIWLFELALPLQGLTENEFIYYAGAIPYDISNQVDIAPGDFIPWWGSVFTAMFLHGGWLHVLFNMLFLWIFGNNVEDTMGRVRFLVFYLLCGLAATGAQVLIDPDSIVPTIGASGAIAGVLGGYIMLFPRARVLTFILPFFVLPVPAWIFLAIWFGLQLVQGLSSLGMQTDIAFFAHIGGFVAGLLFVWVFTTRRARASRRVEP
jgi:membrane associated rhomboid family serine protease